VRNTSITSPNYDDDQIIENEDEAQRWQYGQQRRFGANIGAPAFPADAVNGMPFGRRWECCQNISELGFEPGVKHRVGA